MPGNVWIEIGTQIKSRVKSSLPDGLCLVPGSIGNVCELLPSSPFTTCPDHHDGNPFCRCGGDQSAMLPRPVLQARVEWMHVDGTRTVTSTINEAEEGICWERVAASKTPPAKGRRPSADRQGSAAKRGKGRVADRPGRGRGATVERSDDAGESDSPGRPHGETVSRGGRSGTVTAAPGLVTHGEFPASLAVDLGVIGAIYSGRIVKVNERNVLVGDQIPADLRARVEPHLDALLGPVVLTVYMPDGTPVGPREMPMETKSWPEPYKTACRDIRGAVDAARRIVVPRHVAFRRRGDAKDPGSPPLSSYVDPNNPFGV